MWRACFSNVSIQILKTETRIINTICADLSTFYAYMLAMHTVHTSNIYISFNNDSYKFGIKLMNALAHENND